MFLEFLLGINSKNNSDTHITVLIRNIFYRRKYKYALAIPVTQRLCPQT